MFSQHNLLADPPFSHMHLVSCRNLLIYLKSEVQDKILQMFHFALNPEGYLFLGKSETIGEHHELFMPVDKQLRLYRSVPTERKIPIKLPLVADASTTRLGKQPAGNTARVAHAELVRELLLRQRSATAVLIGRDSQVLYFYGPTQYFIWQPEGAATRDLLSMVSDEMRIALRAVTHSVRGEGKKGEIILPVAGGKIASCASGPSRPETRTRGSYLLRSSTKRSAMKMRINSLRQRHMSSPRSRSNF